MIETIELFPEWMVGIIFLCGLAFFIVIITAIICGLFSVIKELIGKIKWAYRYKHRFGKKPIAKCYCIDCDEWHRNGESDDGRCWALQRITADNWFCWEAKPK